MLTAAQRHQWTHEGYLVLRSAAPFELRAPALAALQAQLARQRAVQRRLPPFLRTLTNAREDWVSRRLAPTRLWGRSAARLEGALATGLERWGLGPPDAFVRSAFRWSPAVRELILGGPAHAAARGLSGAELVLAFAHFWDRSPGYPLHVDGFETDGVPPAALVGVWFALGPVDARNGALLVVPGSHVDPAATAPVPLSLAPGDVALWDGRLVHGSGAPEAPTRPRLGLGCHLVDRAAVDWPAASLRRHDNGVWRQWPLRAEVPSLATAWRRAQG